MRSLKKLPYVLFGLGLLTATLYATAGSEDKATNTKVAFNAPEQSATRLPAADITKDSGTFFFSAPPGGTYDEEAAKYQPIADHLSRVTGKRFVYRYTDNWLTYSKNMASGTYDLVFDGAALNGWRIDRINHTPLVKLSDDLVFVVVARSDSRVAQLKQLAGHRVCAMPLPDVGSLAILSQFDNPARQPVIVDVKDSKDAYKGLQQGKCAGSVVSLKELDTMDRTSVKVVYQHRALPNQAFSAGPRLSPELKEKVRDALLSGPGKTATAALRTAHGGGNLTAAAPGEYVGLGKMLKDSLYYY